MRPAGIYVLLVLTLLGTCLKADQSVSILPLGDSLTWGYSATGDTAGGYRDPLYSLLLGAGVSVNYVGVGTGNPSTLLVTAGQTANDGFNGYSVNQIDENLNANVQPAGETSNLGGFWLTGGGTSGRSAQTANIVLLMAGTNDITVSDGSLTADQIAAQITANIQNLINDVRTDEPNATILVASPPPVILFGDWFDDSEALSGQLSTLISTDYKNQNIYFVDMFDALNSYSYYQGEDGVHLNESGYQAMADEWDSAIVADYYFNDIDPVPEPSTWALFAGGAAVLLGWRRLRRMN